MKSPQEVFSDAVKHFGNQTALAEAIGYTGQALTMAKVRGHISGPMAAAIDLASNGKFPRWALAPEEFTEPAEAAEK